MKIEDCPATTSMTKLQKEIARAAKQQARVIAENCKRDAIKSLVTTNESTGPIQRDNHPAR